MTTFMGILLVFLSGLGTGTIAWPMKRIKTMQFEHYWFIGMLTGLIIIPWLVVLLTVPHAMQAYAEVGWKTLLIGNLLSMGWGIANVLYGICIVRIGAGLAGAILTALGVSVGSIMPMLIKGTGLFSQAPGITSPAGIAILAGVAVILLGIVFMTRAGFGREKVLNQLDEETRKKQAGGGFMAGLIMVAIAGVLSAFISLTFVYSQGPIVESLKSHGASDISANIGVWVGALFGGALVNVIYPMVLMAKNKNWSGLLVNGKDFIFAMIIGVQFMTAFVLLGRGMIFLGALGASVGFGIQQSIQILGTQAVGFMSGEWRGVTGVPRKQMTIAIAVLIVAVAVMAYANTLK